MRLERSEPAEGQLDDGGAHLGADAVSLGATYEPGTGRDRSERREVLRHEVLHPDGLAVDDDRERERPVVHRPARPLRPPPLERLLLAPGGGNLGPGDPERLAIRLVDPFRGNGREHGEVLVARIAQLEARGAHDEVVERPEVRQRVSTFHVR